MIEDQAKQNGTGTYTKKKFNQNVVYTKKIGVSYLIPTNRKEAALINKGVCKNKKQHKSLLRRLRTNLR